ncbi:hypothetical protein CHLNCDRAFT_52221 [Chlorella variabilis]|uniref:Uncharacterized protein n=1 Tax=Chlorella variabilis TaxID=554065 RepID=E1ZF38_CHLVA|nr:hypothetical protein CHLNCDRAFT_52221 [Chlorella variabilis]EFN55431.1 hypothetical protein CHLNCDRAFT_52221 [Chlorella variabilis]|eukprot:XP_005847533.1 hypothetical protein CHLNCDRAFT_52221 [Chlorella variabilis]
MSNEQSNNGLKLDVKTGKLSLWRLFPTFTFTFYYNSDTELEVMDFALKDYRNYKESGFRPVELSAGIWHLAKANEPEASFYEELAMHDLFKGVWNVRTHLKKKTVCSSTFCMQDIIPSDGRVNNISAVGVEEDGDVYPWTLQGSEHAKMAVCIDRSDKLVMVGDLNNTLTQKKRGGGGIVLRQPRLNKMLQEISRTVDTP